MTAQDRAKARRERMVVGRSNSHEEAEVWDLSYWQSRTPAERLEAYMAIRHDVETVEAARVKDSEDRGIS